MTENESQLHDVVQGLQLTVNGLVEPFPRDDVADTVAGLRRSLTSRRRGMRDQLRADVIPQAGEILDAIWTRATRDGDVVGMVLLGLTVAGVAVATLHH